MMRTPTRNRRRFVCTLAVALLGLGVIAPRASAEPGPAAGPPRSATSAATVPGAPRIRAALAADRQARLFWEAPPGDGGAAIVDYRVTVWQDGVPRWTQSFGVAYVGWVTGLVNGTTYQVTVAAVNAVGAGPESSPPGTIVPYGPPGQVASAVARPGNGTAIVAWTPPTDVNGSEITGYYVTPVRDGVPQAGVEVGASERSTTIYRLEVGATYRFRVQALNLGGFSGAVSTAPIVVGAPQAPRAAAALPGAGSATVTWTAPAWTNGSPILRYRVTPYVGSTALATVTVDVNTTSATVTGLTDGDALTFRVVAVNARGAGPAATTRAVVVGAPLPPTVTAALAPASATVSWTVPASNGSALTGYRLQIFRDGSQVSARELAPTATSIDLSGLVAGASYRFQVSARNARGLGPAGTTATLVAT